MRSDEREHLMLQVVVLAEKEITAVLNMQQQMATHAGAPEVHRDAEISKLSQQTAIDEVAKTIHVLGDRLTERRGQRVRLEFRPWRLNECRRLCAP